MSVENELTRKVPVENEVTRKVFEKARDDATDRGKDLYERERRRLLGLEEPPTLPMIEVWSTVELFGFHCWPEAAALNPKRGYLSQRHRHKFIVTAHVRVHGGERDVEFHDLHDLIVKWWDDPERGSQSCEVMAILLRHYLTAAGQQVTKVCVSEDGYDGATVTWKLTE